MLVCWGISAYAFGVGVCFGFGGVLRKLARISGFFGSVVGVYKPLSLRQRATLSGVGVGFGVGTSYYFLG